MSGAPSPGRTWTLPTTWSTWLPWASAMFRWNRQRTLDDPFAIKEGDLPAVEAEYEKLARQLQGRKDVNFFHFNVDLAQGPCVIKRLRAAGRAVSMWPSLLMGTSIPVTSLWAGRSTGWAMSAPGGLRYGHLREVRGAEHLHPGGLPELLGPLLLQRRLLRLQPACQRRHKNAPRGGVRLERKRLECAIALKAIAAGMAE